MSWIKVAEQGHLATSDTSGDELTATRFFVAVSDAPATPTAAESADDGTEAVPEVGDGHPDDATRTVRKLSVRPDEDSPATVFRVQVDYSNKAANDGAAPDPDPLARPDEITWDFSDASESYFYDRSDTPKPCVNSAGDLFESLLERETGSIVATVRRNVPASGTGSYSPATAVTYKDAVNSAAFNLDGVSIGVGQAKLKAWVAGPKRTENGITYRDTTFTIGLREDWDDKVDDRGFYHLVGGDHAKIFDTAPVDKPWPLDGAGNAKPNSTDAPFRLTFRPYKRLSFAPFAFS